ncbi:MAG TPA: hypothetical protein VFU27_10970 [Terriglobales bacterium]|nr:hypothetical protein [Terriglobales bacterium]
MLIGALLLTCVLPVSAAISGTFRGVIVRAPAGEASHGWIYVQGRNGNLRRAEVSHARVVYAGSVPVDLRDQIPARSLKEGAEVRVTASQDGKGEWRASEVEILRVKAPHHRPRPRVQPADDRAPGLNSAL